MNSSSVTNYTDEEFRQLIYSSNTIKEIAVKIGIINTKAIRLRLERLLTEKELENFRNKNRSKYRSIDIDNLKNTVASSETWVDLLKSLGYSSFSGKLNRELRDYLDQQEIDHSHLATGQNWTQTEVGKQIIQTRIRSKCGLKIENAFRKDSGSSNITLKKMILKNNLIENKCHVCNMPPEWLGRKMNLVLDHINGDNTDNTLENLQFVCYNCDSQLETSKGKNKYPDI